jgi:hypothetical protein
LLSNEIAVIGDVKLPDFAKINRRRQHGIGMIFPAEFNADLARPNIGMGTPIHVQDGAGLGGFAKPLVPKLASLIRFEGGDDPSIRVIMQRKRITGVGHHRAATKNRGARKAFSENFHFSLQSVLCLITQAAKRVMLGITLCMGFT